MSVKLLAPPKLAALLLLATSLPAAAQIGQAVERWSPAGPEGGTITALAIAPGSPATLYAGTKEGLIFRSTDAGARWSLTAELLEDFVGSAPVTALAVDPRDPAVVYAAFCHTPPAPAFPLGGIFRSADGGATWTEVENGLLDGSFDCQVTDMTLDAGDPDSLFATTLNGLYETDDSGGTWSRNDAPGAYLTAVETDPFTAGTLFVLDLNGGVLKSTDGGTTWAPRNNGLPTALHLLGLEIDPQTPGTLYVTALPGAAPAVAPIYRSTDGGETWAPAAQGLGGRRVNDLTAAGSPGGLYAATADGVFRSQDGGLNWTAPPPGQARDVLVVAASSSGPVVAGTRHLGVFQSTDSGALWNAVNRGLTGLAVDALAIAPSNPSVLYAVIRDLSLQRSDDGGATWRPAHTGLPVVPTALWVDPRDPRIVFTTRFDGIWRTTDGGAGWRLTTSTQATCTQPRALVFDPRNRNNLYSIGFECPQNPVSCPGLKSTDRGASWTCMDLPSNGYISLAIDPANSAVLVAGGAFHDHAAMSSDGGLHWTTSQLGLASAGVTSLAWTPTPKVLYAGTTLGLYRRAGNSATWVRANAPFYYAHKLAAAPSDPAVLHAYAAAPGSLLRIHRSFDAGATWRPAPLEGLPGGWFDTLVPHPVNSRVLYVLTRAGIYRLGQTAQP